MLSAKIPEPGSKILARYRNNLSARYLLLWDIMVASGLRVSDAIALTRHQALGGAPVIAAKTGKPLTLHLPDDICRRIQRQMAPSDVYVFASRDRRRAGLPIRRQTAAAAFRRAAKAARCPGISAHSARKLFAINLYAATGDLAAVQSALQHSNVTTTAIYLLSARVA